MKFKFLVPLLMLFCFPLRVSAEAESNTGIKTLTAKEFSKYAINLCKKVNLIGPTEITSLAQRDSLLSSLYRLKMDKLIQLENSEIEKDPKAKAKIQSEISSLEKELKKFPQLHYKRVEGYVKPSSQEQSVEYSSASYPKLAPSSPEYRTTNSFKAKYPLLVLGAEKNGGFIPSTQGVRIRVNAVEQLGGKYFKQAGPEIHDSIKFIREQIRLKHGKYYAL